MIHGTIFGICPVADLTDLGRMSSAWRYRAARRSRDQAAHYGKLFIVDLVVVEVGDRAAAWLGATRRVSRSANSAMTMNRTAEQ